jgi:hypothetical protein
MVIFHHVLPPENGAFERCEPPLATVTVDPDSTNRKEV